MSGFFIFDLPPLQKLVSDGEAILLDYAHIDGMYFQIGAGGYIVLALVSFFLFLWCYNAWLKLRLRPKQEPQPEKPIKQPENEPVAKLDAGDFGKVIDDDHVLVKKQKFKYFIIKEKPNQSEKLPIGTIIVVLKQNGKEAHVKAADDNDLKKLKARGIQI